MNKINKLHPIHKVYDGIFNSCSGVQVSLKEPTAKMIVLQDIAVSLNNICRFGGQIPEFYSVLQHSLLVYALAPKELAGVALLHDATEGYLGDVIKPLKVILDYSYSDIEKRFQKAIFERFSLDESLMSAIKRYDTQALQMEHDYFFNIRKSPLKHILDMFKPDVERRSPFIVDTDWVKIYKDLVYENCPNLLNDELIGGAI